jgi:hypothetical protein
MPPQKGRSPWPLGRRTAHHLLSLSLCLLVAAALALPGVAATPPVDTEALVSNLVAKAAGPVTEKLASEVRCIAFGGEATGRKK